MLNLTQFDGATPGPWNVHNSSGNFSVWIEAPGETVCHMHYTHKEYTQPTAELIAAAPEMLAEVKRLREANQTMISMLNRTIEALISSNDFIPVWVAAHIKLTIMKGEKE